MDVFKINIKTQFPKSDDKKITRECAALRTVTRATGTNLSCFMVLMSYSHYDMCSIKWLQR